MLIDSVRIKNFRSLKSLEIALLPITVLVGTNNAGKTSFLRAMAFALNADRRSISQDDLFIDSEGAALPDQERVICIDLRFVPSSLSGKFDTAWTAKFGDAINMHPTTGNDFYAFRTIVDFTLANQEPVTKRFVILDWDKELVNESKSHLPQFNFTPAYFIDAQRDLLEDLKTSSSYVGKLVKQIQYDPESLKEIEELINSLNKKTVDESSVLRHLKQYLEELNKAIQTKGRGVEITPFPQKVRDLHKGMKVSFQDGTSDSFNLEYHGMGTRSWASLLTLKAFIAWESEQKTTDGEPYFPLLALEEPEAHLHPNAQRQVYRQLSQIPGQKIISTHSPFIAGQAGLEELRHFKKEKAETEVKSIDSTQFDPEELRKVKRMVINTKGEVLFSKVVVLVEGETEEQALPIFAERYWKTPPYEKGITIIGCSGTNYKPFLELLHSLGHHWCIFSDYDNENVKAEVGKALKVVGVTSPDTQPNVVLLGKKIEAYLVSAGYQTELRESVILAQTPIYANEQHRKAKEPEFEATKAKIRAYSDDELILELSDMKTKVGPIYADQIAAITDENRAIPPKVRSLFSWIDTVLA